MSDTTTPKPADPQPEPTASCHYCKTVKPISWMIKKPSPRAGQPPRYFCDQDCIEFDKMASG